MKIKPRLNIYSILSDKIEEGINYGWVRAHKHTDNPSQDIIKENLHREIMNSLSEIINYED